MLNTQHTAITSNRPDRIAWVWVRSVSVSVSFVIFAKVSHCVNKWKNCLRFKYFMFKCVVNVRNRWIPNNEQWAVSCWMLYASLLYVLMACHFVCTLTWNTLTHGPPNPSASDVYVYRLDFWLLYLSEQRHCIVQFVRFGALNRFIVPIYIMDLLAFVYRAFHTLCLAVLKRSDQ